jgi:CubicO group peptidase (beta-lactamase class C family)
MRFKMLSLIILVLFSLSSGLVFADSAQMKEAKPESAGFSSERLQRLDRAMQGLVANKTFAGMVTVLARHGKIVDYKVYGMQDLQNGTAMAKDTIFRCASMAKPVTAVAMMILYEEGRWRPEDPLSKYVPEFAELKVFAGLDKDGKPTVEEVAHPPTVGELMSQTAGFSYGFRPNSNPIDKMYDDANIFQSASLQDFINKLANVPLLYQPGTRRVYSVSVDIQGYLVEKLSGMSLPDFMRERIFEPLGMKDSGFFVPESKLSRLATTYHYDPAKSDLAPLPKPATVSVQPAMPSGGGGLISTAPDYARFAQMLLNGGQLNGVRILAPSSVELMRSNHLPDRLLANGEFGVPTLPNGFALADSIKIPDAFAAAFFKARPGIGYGYDVGVIFDPDKAGRTVGQGTFHWDGGFGTWFWVDPTNDVIFVGMVQRADFQSMPNVEELARTMVYQALVSPKK